MGATLMNYASKKRISTTGSDITAMKSGKVDTGFVIALQEIHLKHGRYLRSNAA